MLYKPNTSTKLRRLPRPRRPEPGRRRGKVFSRHLGPNGSGKMRSRPHLVSCDRPPAEATPSRSRLLGRQRQRPPAHLLPPRRTALYERPAANSSPSAGCGDEHRGEVDALARRPGIDLDRPIGSSVVRHEQRLATWILLPRIRALILDRPTSALDPTMHDELLASTAGP